MDSMCSNGASHRRRPWFALRPSLILLSGLLLLGGRYSEASPPFEAGFHGYLSDGDPRRLAVGHLDGDGFLDVVTVNKFGPNPGTISIFWGDGTGNFPDRTDVPDVSSAQDAALSDLDADGNLDVVVLGVDAGTILTGHGDRTFDAPVTVPAAGTALAMDDLNSDELPDLAVANDNGTISVMLGNGDGTFGPGTTYDTGGFPASIKIARLDANSSPDLMVLVNQGLREFLGNGDGTFTPGPNPSVSLSSFSLADLDADGKTDLIFTEIDGHSFGYHLYSSLGNGDGTFGPPLSHVTGYFPRMVGIGDMTSDGIPDAVILGREMNYVAVLPGLGNGAFGAPLNQVFAGSGDDGNALVDLNADGHLDVVAPGSFGSMMFFVALGTGHGAFGRPVVYHDGLHYKNRVALADVDEDGALDAAVINSDSPSVSILLGNGLAGFTMMTSYPCGPQPWAVLLRDLNHDDHLDLVLSGNPCTVRLGNGDGTFGDYADYEFAHWIALGDVNGDGTLDMASAPRWFTDTVSVRLGNGDGTFGTRYMARAPSPPSGIAMADMDNDQLDDVLVSNLDANSVSMFLSNGDGTLKPRQDYAVGASPYALAVIDVDEDDQPDIVTANAQTVSLILANEDGSFAPATSFPAASTSAHTLAAGDVNGDGHVDLVIPVFFGYVNLYLGNGDATFAGRRAIGTRGGTVQHAVLGDMTGDGFPEIVTVHNDTTVSVLWNLLGSAPPVSVPAVGPGTVTLRLEAPRPNPTFAGARVRFVVPGAAPVDLEVFDLSGRLVRTVIAGKTFEPGAHDAAWDGRDDRGLPVRTGLYMIRVRALGMAAVRKLAVLR